MATHRLTKHPVACAVCGKSFHPRLSQIALGEGKFCGLRCYHESQRTTPQSFWLKLDRTGECWLWTGGVYKSGYGSTAFAGLTGRRKWAAHRLAWTLANGPIPNGLCVLHKCDANYPMGSRDYRRCCNPAHLWLGTRPENQADMAAKGRQARGERHGVTTLTTEQVVEMRRLHAAGVSTAMLGRQFHTSQATASRIVSRRTWRHVS